MTNRKSRIGTRAKRVNLKILMTLNRDLNIHMKMAQNITDNGKETTVMVLELKYGQTELNMKDIGRIIRHMGKEHFGMFMVMYMMDIGKETKHMEKESTLTKMEQHTMEIGRMITIKKFKILFQSEQKIE